MTEQPAHSPLGASSAERWLECPGSTALLKHLQLPQSDEPDYQRNGTAAHAAAADCLTKNMDGWEIIGQSYEGVEVDEEIATAVQLYLDTCRAAIAGGNPDDPRLVEYRISDPDVHRHFYGTCDFSLLNEEADRLEVYDYKHGEGIQVDAFENPQLMYYAFGILRRFPEFKGIVRLRIIQPRGFHADGPIRTWVTDAFTIRKWAVEVLIPAMNRAELDDYLEPGSWCRFCPAKLVCPMLTSLFGAACLANPKDVVNLNTEALDRSYEQREGVKFYLKALEDEVFRRLNNGEEMKTAKLVNKKANRVFKDGAEERFVSAFGEQALTKPALKSPAEMEKIGPPAKALVNEWAYSPKTGLTVAPMKDPRLAIKVQTLAETYAGAGQDAD